MGCKNVYWINVAEVTDRLITVSGVHGSKVLVSTRTITFRLLRNYWNMEITLFIELITCKL